jgi:hypothetical protein
MGTRSSIGVPVWIQMGFLAALGILGFVYANRPEHWQTLRQDIATERSVVRSPAFWGLDGYTLIDVWMTGAPGPLETLQIREARMGWNLRETHPRLWENYLQRVEQHSPGEAVHLEYLMETMDRKFALVAGPLKAQSSPLIGLRQLQPWLLMDQASFGREERMRVSFASPLQTAAIGRYLTVGSPSTTATVPLTVAGGRPVIDPGVIHDYWYFLTTEIQPDQSDLRRIPAVWQRQGGEWVFTVDLSKEPAWIHPEAHISELILTRTPRKQ